MKTIITFLFICFYSVLSAQTQYLDTSFGNQGKIVESFPNQQSRPVEKLPLENGNFLLLSFKYVWQFGNWSNFQFYLSRYDSNGQLDTSFGTNGFLVYPLTSTNSGRAPLLDMIKLNDGKIMVYCYHNNISTLLRLTNTGNIDNNFGQNGEVNLSIGEFYRILQTADNKFILLGQYFDGYNNMYQFARLNANATLDTSFGTNGIKVVDLTSYRFDIMTNVQYTSDNKIIIIGMSYDQMTTTKGVVSRFTASGNLDTSFGTNGTITLNVNTSGNNAILNDVILQQSNGVIVVCGDAMSPGGTGGFYGAQPFLAKINTNGTMVQQFGSNGIKYYNPSFNANDSFKNITFHNDNILISGSASYPFPYMQTYYYLRLVKSDGSDVSDFGTNGTLHFNLSTTSPDFVNSFNKSIIVNNNIYGLGMSTYVSGLDYATTFFKLKEGTLNTTKREMDSFNIYPNPANSIVNISGQKNVEIEQIKIIDTSGKTIFTKNFARQQEIQMDVSFLASGTYILTISTAKGSTTHKLIKK